MGITYLDEKLVLFIHNQILASEAGLKGISADISLTSVLHRIHAYAHYENKTEILEIAAMYAVSIARGHAFLDANKRTAFMSMYVFLSLNNYTLTASDYDTEIEDLMVNIADKHIGELELIEWLKKNVTSPTES